MTEKSLIVTLNNQFNSTQSLPIALYEKHNKSKSNIQYNVFEYQQGLNIVYDCFKGTLPYVYKLKGKCSVVSSSWLILKILFVMFL